MGHLQFVKGGFTVGPHEPAVITVLMARESFHHLLKVLEKGFIGFNATSGKLELTPKARILADALYHALTNPNLNSIATGTWPPDPDTATKGTLTIDPGDKNEVKELQD